MAAAAESIYSSRLEKLYLALESAGFQALALNPGPSLFYLTGLSFHLSERPVVFIFLPAASPVVVLPELEAGKIDALPLPVQAFPYAEDYDSWHAAFRQAARHAGIDGVTAGVEPRRLRLLELGFLQAAAPEAQFQSAEQVLAALRMHKDPAEVDSMQRAVKIAQDALQAVTGQIKPGISEQQLANELVVQLLRHGSGPELPFSPIVASGPNSANPHAAPTDRALAAGDLLVLDWGASVDGYASDLTRTFSLGEPDPELARIAEIVLQANTAARERCAPGMPAGEVDRAARDVIAAAGYAEYFIHRTGHGLGLESHEEPYIRADNSQALAAGMTFTIEPGIYLPGRGGVRIEDNLLITPTGAQTLSDFPRHLHMLPYS
ncbi:MAG TPA: aminopeptidase P family protein [Anaerolineales bacterium]